MKKVTIIAHKPEGWHAQQLIAAANKIGWKATARNLTAADIPEKLPQKLQGAVIWRSSNLDIQSERSSLLGYLANKTVVSDGLFVQPAVRFKYFQQHFLASHPSTAQWSIPTYRVSTSARLMRYIEEGKLTLPVIAKPNAGSKGNGIVLLKTVEDVQSLSDLKKYVFQSFIPNDGDWRIIVVGGAPIGALRRIASKGSFINNVSKGATAVNEADQRVLSELYRIASKVASAFHLAFCGIDVIRDKETGKFFVLEANTAPQWGDEFGFQSITGVNVAESVMQFISDRESIADQPLANCVEDYYKRRIGLFPAEAFHLASRLWLWDGDKWGREQLDKMQGDFIGNDEESIRKRIQSIVAAADQKSLSVNQRQAHRREAYDRFPKLPMYNNLLFKVLFCDTVYRLDIRPYIREYVDDKDFLQLFSALIADGDAIRLLSTHAVNYFYLLSNYYKGDIGKSTAVMIDPYELLELLPGYADLEKAGIISKPRSLKLQINLLTHAIIGRSRFYAQAVKGAAYTRSCRELEALITEHYFEVSLDNKFEFLVCAAMCQYETPLKGMIEQEAKSSLSWNGNFLVDTMNTANQSPARYCMRISEHRNVLFLMSQKPFVSLYEKTPKKGVVKKRIIGRLARVTLPKYDIRRVVARVDSGATRSSIAASNIRLEADGLHFTLMYPEHYLYTGREFVVKEFQEIDVKTTSSKKDVRYAVQLEVAVDDFKRTITCTLADRSHMLYPMLLGRNFLSGKYSVDIERQFVRTVRVPSKRARVEK